MQHRHVIAHWKVRTAQLMVAAIGIGLFPLAPLCDAAILTVAPNGAQYSTIQAAVDAAASGDTVLVAPGRYTDAQWVPTAAGDRLIYVKVGVEELTLIGSGSEATIVGPYAPYDVDEGTMSIGIAGGSLFGNREFVVRNFGFENLRVAFDGTSPADSVVFEGVRFASNLYGIIADECVYGEFVSCVFDDLVGWKHVTIHRQREVIIRDCVFYSPSTTSYIYDSIHFQDCQNVGIDSSTFFNGGYGPYSVDCGSCTVTNCRFVAQSRGGLLFDRTNGDVEGCTFENQYSAIILSNVLNDFEIYNTAVTNTQSNSIAIIGIASLSVGNCSLAHGARYTVAQTYECDPSKTENLPVLDLTNNDWGTTDPDTIASWIHLCDYEADFMPYVGQVANDAQTWDGFKALFR